MLWIAYSNMHKVVSEEYLIVNFPTIVSSVGGALGLFLGTLNTTSNL